jgi:hypothetical protein
MTKLECRIVMANNHSSSVAHSLSPLISRTLPSLLPALTGWSDSVVIGAMKVLAALLLLASETSCTTIANRRDLYSPQPAPDLDWHRQAAQHVETAAPPEYR